MTAYSSINSPTVARRAGAARRGRFTFIESRLAPLQQVVNNATTDEQRQAANEAFGFAWENTNKAVAPLQLINYVVTTTGPSSSDCQRCDGEPVS